MGIYDFYFKWLKKQLSFAGAVRKNFPKVSSFSIDGNSLIHNNAQIVYAYGDRYTHLYGKEKGPELKKARQERIKGMSDQDLEIELFTAIGSELLKLIALVNPTQYFFLAIDGPAPQAKISQQRSRRFKNSKDPTPQEVEATGVEPLPLEPVKVEAPSRFDINSISPGTDMMTRLDKYLTLFLERNINNLTNVVHYSSHIVPGEGEHKIMEYYRTGKIRGNDYHVIYGMDSDLILLSMSVNIIHMLLWREDIGDILDIDALKYSLIQRMGGSPTASDDFVLIMTLFGNDFLPTQPSLGNFLESIDSVLNIYADIYKKYGLNYITRTGPKGLTVNWKNFSYLLYNLSVYETDLLKEEAKVQERDPKVIVDRRVRFFIKRESLDYATLVVHENGEIEEGPFDFDKFRNFWYHHELDPRGNPDLLIKYGGKDAIGITLDKINDMVKSYLNGILFVFNYYFVGATGINLKWYYNYFHTPLFLDIYNYVSTIDFDTEVTESLPKEGNSFINVFHQLLSILPVKSILLVPQELRRLMTDVNSPIIDYYPIDFIVDYELKDQDYKGIPILPFVNPARIISAVNTGQKFSYERIKYYMESKPREYIRDVRMKQLICSTGETISQLSREASRQGRGRGRGRGGQRGGRGRGDPRRGTDEERGDSGRGTGEGRVTFTPRYEINQGPYDNKPDLNFNLPTI